MDTSASFFTIKKSKLSKSRITDEGKQDFKRNANRNMSVTVWIGVSANSGVAVPHGSGCDTESVSNISEYTLIVLVL